MDRCNSIRFRHTKLLETTLARDPRLHQQGPHGPIAAEDPRLQFVEQIHPRCDYFQLMPWSTLVAAFSR